MRFLAISAVIGAVTLGSVWAMEAPAVARGLSSAPHAIAATNKVQPKASAAPMDKKEKERKEKDKKPADKMHKQPTGKGAPAGAKGT